jgi:hypothetical protein
MLDLRRSLTALCGGSLTSRRVTGTRSSMAASQPAVLMTAERLSRSCVQYGNWQRQFRINVRVVLLPVESI